MELSMPEYYSIFWVPYLIILFILYKKRNAYAPVLLIIVGMLQYKLPIFFIQNIEPAMWFVGLILCVTMSIADVAVQGKSSRFLVPYSDRKIKIYIIIYSCSIFFSVMFMSSYPLMKKITFGFDYVFLAFIVMQCIKNEKDIEQILKGVLFSVLLMATIGFIGYFFDDPYWGHTISSDQTDVIYAKSIPGLTYSERLKCQALIVKNTQFISILSLRPRFTSSSPNGLGVTMLLAIPLLLFFYIKSYQSIVSKTLYLTGALLLLASILITGSRTVLIAGGLIMPILFFLLFRVNYVKKIRFLILISFFLFGIIPVLLSNSISDITKNRMSTIHDQADIVDANGRQSRWRIHLTNLTPEILIFGNGQIGAVGHGTKIAHSNYLSTLYRGGGAALLAFLLCFYRCKVILQRNTDKLFSICLSIPLVIYAFTSISLDLNIAVGPPFIFWTLVGIIATSSNITGHSYTNKTFSHKNRQKFSSLKG